MRYSVGTSMIFAVLLAAGAAQAKLAAGAAQAKLAAGAAQAKSARCFVTDEGEYPCRFKSTGVDGGFEISAPGKDWYSLVVDEKGVASGYANYGTGRNVALPGRFYRQADDPACWKNDSTATRICAW